MNFTPARESLDASIVDSFLRSAGTLLDRVADETSHIEYHFNILCNHLTSKSALQRTVSALVITEWALLRASNVDSIPVHVKDCLQRCLLESIYFDEIALSYTKVLQDTKDYITLLKTSNVPIDETLANKVRHAVF